MFSKETYRNRRNELKKMVESGIILLPGNNNSPMSYKDNPYHFRQDSSFLYYFGLDEPGLAGVIDVDNDEEIIFGDDVAIEDIIWMGPLPKLVDKAEKIGVAVTKPSSELRNTIQNYIKAGRQILYLPQYRADTIIQMEGTGSVAAIVLEPIQGWSGSIVYPDGYLTKIRKLCDKLKIMLNVDEVLTCCARTGKMYCFEHDNIVPDIVTLGKGLANGFPCTAFVIKEEYSEVLEKISASTSYGGNPMASAAGLASLEVIEEEAIVEKSAKLGDFILKHLKTIRIATR